MSEFFKRIRIRTKLLLAFGSLILLSVLLTVYSIYSISRIIKLERLNEETGALSVNLGLIELASKEFIFEGYKEKSFHETGTHSTIVQFDSALADAKASLLRISASDLIHGQAAMGLVNSMAELDVITKIFHETKELLEKRGFKDSGLEGTLRKAIHEIESSDHYYDRALMLTLRRHEKDFFLRKDLKYHQEFTKTINAFGESLQQKNNTDLMSLLNAYEREFNQVVAIEQQIGLTQADGKKGQLFAKLNKARRDIESIQYEVHAIASDRIEKSKIYLLIIFLVQSGVAVMLSLAYSNIMTSVVKEIQFSMKQLADGNFPPPLPVRSSEEIGQTKLAINQFLDRMNAATSFAEELGNGKLHAHYDSRFGQDVLAKALIRMQHKLNETEAIQSRINWTNEGAARFSDILKSNIDDLQTLGDQILKLMVEYLDVNQAALYILNHQEKYMERIATYAYGRKKYVNDRIEFGSGLAGQCVAEGEALYLKEIPADYVKITSGLGEAAPRNILLVPLKLRDTVYGVLEMASFNLFEAHHIHFVKNIAENIASVLYNHESAIKTKALLEESQKRANDLMQQEEEMRQNAEELQATQEEMERQRKELEQKIISLQDKLAHYENRYSLPLLN